MADPLRRTILAKLRGKKSKKSTAVGGCGVSAIGDREGKDDVLQKRNERNQQEPPCSGLSVIPATMWGNASGLNRQFDNRDFALVRENTVVADEVTQYGAFMDINSSRAIVQASENLTLRVRVNEELLGVSDQSQIPTRVNVHNFNGKEPNFPRQVRPGFLERAHDQKKHTVPMPRKYSFGDSIGFGTCENYSSNSKNCADIGPVKLTDGGCPISKNKACKEDLKIPFNGTALGSTSESNRGFINAFVVRTDANIRADNINNKKKLFQFDASDVYQVDSQEAEGHVLIQSIESYENTVEHLGVNKVNNVQSPAFFPTELEICDISRPDRCQGPREGTQRHNSLDSEDDDYYDNEILTLYEPESKNCDINEGESSSERSEFKNCGSALETDRLRIQLKEAYHLLINAMQDISFDSQVPVNGFSHRMSIPSHSQDSVCTQSSAKVVDSDPCSSGNNSPQQFSDTDSLILNSTKTQVQGLKSTLISKSCDSLITAKGRQTLQKSASDGNIDYGVSLSGSRSLASQISVVCHYGQPGRVAAKEKQPVHDGISSDDLPESVGDGPVNDSSGSVNSLTGSSDCAESQGSRVGFNSAQGIFAKPHGVTVNKMQEWMHRGCVLSSKMRQRITGPSPCGLGVSGHGLSDKTNPTTQMPSVPGSKSAIPFQGPQQSALTENVHSSITAAVDARPGRPADSLTPLNTITVSKKRNWLEQSSFKSYTGDEDVINGGLDDGLGHVAHHGCPSLDPCGVHVPMPAPGLCQSESQHQTCVDAGRAKDLPQCRPVDPTEENDADDEGEIWYNPIPEDEEPEPHSGDAPEPPGLRRRVCSRRLMGGSADHCLGGLGGEAGHMNATHSTEAAQLHRQMFACKTVEERPAARAPATDAAEASTFSPPSSPSPTKKGSSINWSFPDKIKSPRTVRKLSMKMKKLPELSRKLSAKTPLGAAPPGPRPLSPKPSRSTEPGQGAPPPAHMPIARAGQAAASRNVISRYHLDSSVSTQHSYGNKKSSEVSKSASKGGYLSDGDSPELLAKSQKHSTDAKPTKGKESTGGGGGAKLHGAELDVDAFRHYSSAEQPKCSQYISGLMNLHFYGAEDLKPPRVDSRDVFCAIQVDCVNKARTALLTCRTAFLDMDHAFNIELENAQHLKLVVFSWEATPRRNRVCCHGTVLLPALFRVSRAHQLAVKLEPRGIIYVKLNLMERWHNSLDGPEGDHAPQVFGIDVWKLVEQENVGLMVPLIIEKCITEIENRGCQVVGLYRLCGSAAVKKELREAFEKDSRLVELCENQYPDVHVITGVLKDYLRELPYPLISKELYEAVLDSMAKRPLRIGASGNENNAADSEHTVTLLDILPDVEKATLRMLLDHLKLVASHHEVNKMTCQNLAVCFGPVLLSQRQEVSSHSNRVFVDSEELNSALHFKKHIEVLHYLLQLWPVADACCAVPAAVPEPSAGVPAAPQYLRRRRQRPQVLNLSAMDMSGMLRPKAGRLDSPSNRYAGDWSGCGESYLLPASGPGADEADYDDVASEDADDSGDRRETPGQIIVATEEQGGRSSEWEAGDAGSVHLRTELSTNHILETQEHTYQAYMKIQEISPVLRNRVNLKDLQESIDTLIGNLERELNKNKLHLSY